jgi:rhodanese-related sulfurtransferase
LSSIDEISAPEAARLLDEQPETTTLLDVRELNELATAALAGAFHIPMGDIPTRINELDKSKTIICLCRSGGRSAQVAAYLNQQGYTDVRNLTGGINAWSETVDPSIPRY